MTEKIEWYKEVLSLEPASKIFFPLAKLLVEAHREDEAISVLEQGLARHEEFLEARLFLIDILYRLGHREACDAQVARLGTMFASYAGFWQAWAACLNASGLSPDAAAVLRFLALSFSRGPVALHEVLERGIAASMPPSPALSPEPCPTPEEAQTEAVPLLPGDAFPSVSFAEDEGEAGGMECVEEEVYSPTAIVVPEAAGEDEEGAAEEDGGEENFSLRTRSMAEVLAEQGDVRGALDIYHELAAAAVDPGENADLRQRITTLNARLGNTAEEQTPDPFQASSSGKDKLISMLEALAERVEARAQT